MPGLSLQTQAFVIGKRPPADAFQSLSLFSEGHGSLNAMQRVPKRANPGHTALDLFDEADIALESSNQGRSWFVREVRLIDRHSAIGRSYEALRYASRLASIVARNPVHEESRRAVADLLRTAFRAFGLAARPEIVYFKSLYRFARDEGYPVKQEWLPSLAEAPRVRALELLNRPSGEQTAEAPDVAAITRRLEQYLRGHTEILLD